MKAQEIKKYDDGKKLQKEREELERSIETAKKHRAQTCREMFQAFNAGSSSFFSKSLIYRAMQVLQDETIPSADIPYMHVKTIEYLLRQKKCICGTHLDEGTVPYENVKALMDYLPPQSISTTVSQFKKMPKLGFLRLIEQIFLMQFRHPILLSVTMMTQSPIRKMNSAD